MFFLCVCEREKGVAASAGQRIIKCPGFIWSEQNVQEPLVSYAFTRDSGYEEEGVEGEGRAGGVGEAAGKLSHWLTSTPTTRVPAAMTSVY